MKIILLFGLFISSTERKRFVHSVAFWSILWVYVENVPTLASFSCWRNAHIWAVLLHVRHQGRVDLREPPPTRPARKSVALSCLTFEWMKRVWMKENLATRGFPRAQKPSQNSFSEKKTRDKNMSTGIFQVLCKNGAVASTKIEWEKKKKKS